MFPRICRRTARSRNNDTALPVAQLESRSPDDKLSLAGGPITVEVLVSLIFSRQTLLTTYLSCRFFRDENILQVYFYDKTPFETWDLDVVVTGSSCCAIAGRRWRCRKSIGNERIESRTHGMRLAHAKPLRLSDEISVKTVRAVIAQVRDRRGRGELLRHRQGNLQVSEPTKNTVFQYGVSYGTWRIPPHEIIKRNTMECVTHYGRVTGAIVWLNYFIRRLNGIPVIICFVYGRVWLNGLISTLMLRYTN